MGNTAQSAGGSQPKPPEFRPIDIGALDAQVFKFNSEGLRLSQEDLATRFPGFVAARDQNLKDDAAAITGPLNPTEQAAFVRHGLTNSLNAFGGAQGGLGGEGSISRNTVAATLARDTIQNQDAARTQLSTDLQLNPETQLGLGGAEKVKLAVGNTLGTNVSNYNAYLAALGVLQQQNIQAANNEKALISAAGSVASIYGNYSKGSTPPPTG